MEKMEQQSKPNLTLLFGRICSGKGSYMKDVRRVVVSDIVREIVKSGDRKVLQNTIHLNEIITNHLFAHLYELFKNREVPHVVVDGIRQVEIVERILESYPNAELIWLEVPTEERKRRYEARGDSKDREPFDIADNKPIELECQKIFSTLEHKLKIINNY